MCHNVLAFPRSLFFFSGRRRHTRCLSDWSSDVCSSDLANPFYGLPATVMPGTLRTEQNVTVGQLLVPYPQYGALTQLGWPGQSDHYYALQLKAERPMANGIAFLVAYNYNQERHTAF